MQYSIDVAVDCDDNTLTDDTRKQILDIGIMQGVKLLHESLPMNVNQGRFVNIRFEANHRILHGTVSIRKHAI